MNVQAKLLAIALLLFSGATSSAQQLDFSIDGGNSFGNSFIIAQGSSTDVGVYLSEIPPATTLSTEGLFSLGLKGDLNAGSFGIISSASADSAFDFVTSDSFNTIALEWEAAVLANDIPTSSSVRLGGFQFDSTGAGVSSFTFGDIRTGSNPADINWVTGIGTELDQSIFGPGTTNTYSLTLSTVAVPEPSALSMIVISAMLAGFRRRK